MNIRNKKTSDNLSLKFSGLNLRHLDDGSAAVRVFLILRIELLSLVVALRNQHIYLGFTHQTSGYKMVHWTFPNFIPLLATSIKNEVLIV